MPNMVGIGVNNNKKIVLKTPKNNVENDPKYYKFKDKSLEELLDSLTKYGKHGVSWMGDGWYCRIDVYINVIGTELKVTSDFDNISHKNAVIQCTIRLEETIEKIIDTKGI